MHCCSASFNARLSPVLGDLVHCLSERARKKALPILPQSCDVPNISLPRSLAGLTRRENDMMDSISSKSSSFRDGLILKHMSFKSYVTPRIVGSARSWSFLGRTWRPTTNERSARSRKVKRK